MGQHRIQRQILQNFSFKGRQKNSREVWWIGENSFKPQPRSIRGVGFFAVACSDRVDQYITALEDGFKDKVFRFSQGEFARTDVGRETYDFIAMHYVRSQACRLQMQHMVSECWRTGKLTQPQAEEEYRRLTSHQDLRVFQDLVDSVARTLTYYVMRPLLLSGSPQLLTSDKIIYAGQGGLEERENFIWFPLSPSAGLSLTSEMRTGQILGPIKIHPSIGRISFVKMPEAPFLRCQEPSPQQVKAQVVNTFNQLMVRGSTELYAPNSSTIDSALSCCDEPTGYQYTPTNEHGPVHEN